jgi:hypothetical protein
MGGTSSKESPQKNGRYSDPIPVKGEDYSKPLQDKKLPKELQKIIDNEENLWDSLYEGQ